MLEFCPTCGGEGRHVRDCDLHERCTRTHVSDKVRSCDRCPDHTARPKPAASPVSRFESRPGDVPCGVVIGSYGWPALIDLQLRVMRDACGPVPVCVSSDKPEDTAELAAVCAANADVYLWPNAERIGHTGGDLAAYWKGVVWGAARGLAVVAMISPRFIVTKPRWLQDGTADLLGSGLPLAVRACTDGPGFPLRTEAALLNVGAWHRPGVRARRVLDEAPGRVERRSGDRRTGPRPVGWGVLAVGSGPTAADKPEGAVWHYSHARTDYEVLAARYGVTLPPDFHVEGWEGDLLRGEYRYG